jgi:hypothetical protein
MFSTPFCYFQAAVPLSLPKDHTLLSVCHTHCPPPASALECEFCICYTPGTMLSAKNRVMNKRSQLFALLELNSSGWKDR